MRARLGFLDELSGQLLLQSASGPVNAMKRGTARLLTVPRILPEVNTGSASAM
jgi:hypothetical protein